MQGKLIELAGGQWKGRNLSLQVGSKAQKEHMKVPVLRAVCTKKLSILWQVGVGMYDDLTIEKQLVKGEEMSRTFWALADELFSLASC